MDLILFLKGVAAGFVIAAPVGPVGILCAQRTLHRGFLAGIIAGLGAGIADTIFGAVAAFGLTFIADFLLEYESTMRVIGGCLLVALGVLALLRAAPHPSRRMPTVRGSVGDVLGTFMLTITNPITILTFSPVFLGLGAVVATGDWEGAAILIGGVFAGSMLWWTVLCSMVGLARAKITDGFLIWVNRVSGVLILCFAVIVFATLTEPGRRMLEETGIEPKREEPARNLPPGSGTIDPPQPGSRPD